MNRSRDFVTEDRRFPVGARAEETRESRVGGGGVPRYEAGEYAAVIAGNVETARRSFARVLVPPFSFSTVRRCAILIPSCVRSGSCAAAPVDARDLGHAAHRRDR